MTFIVKMPDGLDYELSGSATLTPVAVPIPIPTPPPTPVPGLLPILVPDPQPYALPEPLRTVRVASQAELAVAIAARRPGDRIVLAAGKYSKIELAYTTNAGTPDAPLQFVGERGAEVDFVNLVVGPKYVILAGMNIGAGGVILNNDVHHIDVVHCNIRSANKRNGIYITNQTVGGFNFVNNVFEWQGEMTPGVNGAEAAAAIFFEAQRSPGKNVRIAGNLGSRYHDIFSLGQTLYNPPSENMTVEHNYLFDPADDAIEADGNHHNLRITDNVIGGTEYGMQAGISVAPGGDGPILIARNSIGGYYRLPVKFNTEIENAYNKGTEVTENIMVPAPNSDIAWYMPGPVAQVANLRIHHNTIHARGAIFVTEQMQWFSPGQVIPGMVLDGNRLWSLRETHAHLFRWLDVSTQRNVWMDSIEELRTKFGWERNGTYAPFEVRAVPIETTPGSGKFFPIEKLCRFVVAP